MSKAIHSIGELDSIREINYDKIKSINISSNYEELFLDNKYFNKLLKMTNLNSLIISNINLENDFDIINILEALINTNMFIIINLKKYSGFTIECISSNSWRNNENLNSTSLSIDIELIINNSINFDYLPNNISNLIIKCNEYNFDKNNKKILLNNVPSSIENIVILILDEFKDIIEIKLPYFTTLHYKNTIIDTMNFISTLF